MPRNTSAREHEQLCELIVRLRARLEVETQASNYLAFKYLKSHINVKHISCRAKLCACVF